MKVLIVDDEINIRQGLKTLIDWQGLGCKVIGEASDGESAIDAIRTIKPDLCIMDIKMPKMDGVSVIETLYKEGNHKTKFIILSGYGEFDYAKRAMACDVNHYVLKPIDERVLEENVKALVDAHKKASIDGSIVLESSLRILFQNGDVSKFEKITPYSLPWKSYQVLSLLFEDSSSKGQMMDGDEVEMVLSKYLKNGYVKSVHGNRIDVLVKDGYYNKTFKAIESIYESFDGKADVAIGRPVKEIQAIVNSYIEASRLIEYRYVYKDDGIMTYHMMKNDGSTVSIDTGILIDTIRKAIGIGNMEVINDSLELLLENMIGACLEEKVLIANYIQFYIRLIMPILQSNHQLEESDYLNDETIKGFYEQKDIRRLHGYIKYHIMELGLILVSLQPEDKIGKVKAYINDHFSEDLLLEEISDLFGYNASYLGKQFKEKAGMSFNAYLDKVRIGKAKQMLMDTSAKIYEIAASCGFRDPDYFATKFKKYESMTPNQYRKASKNL